MKKFILGFVCGVIITLGAIMAIGYVGGPRKSNNEMIGLTLIENGENMAYKQVRIFQVLKPNVALAKLTNYPKDDYPKDELLVLFIGEEKDNFYDNQKIDIAVGKQLKRIGTYNYTAKIGERTVPAIQIK